MTTGARSACSTFKTCWTCASRRDPVSTVSAPRSQPTDLEGLEPGREDQRIELTHALIAGSNSIARYSVDRLRYELDILARERRKVVVGKARSLATKAVARGQLMAKVSIGDLLLEVASAHRLDTTNQAGRLSIVDDSHHHDELCDGVGHQPHATLRCWYPAKQ